MKRPISILCLADIHYDKNGDMSAIESLYPELVKYIDADMNRIKWQPDYIVIAGDVADKNGGYDDVTDFIEKLRAEKAFNISSDRIIVIPGNHDKNTKVSLEQHSKDKDTFYKYCDKADNISCFGDVFAERFKEYIDFSKQYTCDLRFNSEGKKCILDKRLRQLSGVKVFENDHICFLYVNTEWLYVSGREKALVNVKNDKTEHLEDITKFIRLDEDCQLCAPLIKDACDFIKNNYPTYTVITVMHRGFDHFSLKEKDPTDATTIDSIGYLLKISDIIISGHDHVFSPTPPSLIRNHVQHFQLGAVGRKEPKTREFKRSAEIIRLNVSSEKVEQLLIEYKKTDTGFKWCFEESKRNYPIFSKFTPKKELKKKSPYHNDTLLRVKSSNVTDIERTISTYFSLSSPYKLKTIAADLDIKNKLESIIINKENNPIYIVVYFQYHEYIEGLNSQNSPIESIKQKIDLFKNEHINEFLSYQIIINEVVVECLLDDN